MNRFSNFCPLCILYPLELCVRDQIQFGVISLDGNIPLQFLSCVHRTFSMYIHTSHMCITLVAHKHIWWPFSHARASHIRTERRCCTVVYRHHIHNEEKHIHTPSIMRYVHMQTRYFLKMFGYTQQKAQNPFGRNGKR